ncbi:class I SAM-dependent methyltransferase [Mesorhizobium australicum]|uniref:16S rRNA m(2)G 1207 methyltransferase n=1 Tax=Mesorhizobium australicum TaxID=536018 RepID=A0A1X7NCJ8_9HYPH|nr:class I SAM-dependent methyltransferase [Mesorhizobium australicum]SMH35387.1 16S rRNA m(2)G 1207 methyltransferase [Mesorhizobium australicum]
MAAGDDAQRTLFHPFETGDMDVPGKGARVLFLGAEPGFRLPEGFAAELTLVQGFRPDFLKLKAGRHRVVPVADGEGYDLVLVLTGKHKGLNEILIAEAMRRGSPASVILVAGSKDDGIASLRKRLEALAPIEGSLSKFHGQAFWLHRPADARAVAAMLENPHREALIGGRFRATPGMFSHDRIDAGSRLLAQHIPPDLSGAVADFCAGWGYLAAEALERCAGVASLDLFEADFASLEAAKLNLADARVPVGFHWADLASEPVPRKFDAIVMNPPFHQGRAADPAIGNAMIRAASAALKPNGRLYMVANRGLPYEAALSAGFRQSGELVRDQTYKVLWARR